MNPSPARLLRALPEAHTKLRPREESVRAPSPLSEPKRQLLGHPALPSCRRRRPWPESVFVDQPRDVRAAGRDFRPTHVSCAARTSLHVGSEDVREQPSPAFARGRFVVVLAELLEQIELVARRRGRLGRARIGWSRGHDEPAT